MSSRAEYMRQYRQRKAEKEDLAKPVSATQQGDEDWPVVIQKMSQRQRDLLLTKINRSR